MTRLDLFRDPTEAELENLPRPLWNTEPPTGLQLRRAGDSTLWVGWWGNGSQKHPFRVVIVLHAGEGVKGRFPTVEEQHEAAQLVDLAGVMFQAPGFVTGSPLEGKGAFHVCPLMQVGAVPNTPAAFRLQLTTTTDPNRGTQ